MDGATHEAPVPDLGAQAGADVATRVSGAGTSATRHRPVRRTAVVERLLSSTEPVISVVAPPGYGKTTLLSQWAERSTALVAWVSCERSDNDPATLWDDILDGAEPGRTGAEDSRALVVSLGGGVSVVPRIVASLGRDEVPVVVVLDHVEVITSPPSLASFAEFAFRLPAGWRLAVASRDTVPLPIARLRVEGKVIEIGVDDLAMDEC